MKEDELEFLPLIITENVVLFPGTVLQLQVISPKYIDLVLDTIRGNRKVAIALLKPFMMMKEKFPFFTIAGLGEISTYDKISDGVYEIMVRGIGRVEILNIVQSYPYYVVRASLLKELNYSDSNITIVKDKYAFKSLLREIMKFYSSKSKKLQQIINENIPTGEMIFKVANDLINDAYYKQKILEANDWRLRLKMINKILASIITLSFFLRDNNYNTPRKPELN